MSANNFESDTSGTPSSSARNWLKVGLVAGGSALLGGVAAAWWYRKTLARLQQVHEEDKNPQFGMIAQEYEEQD